MKGLYGFVSACALIMTIALIPEYVGIIPGAMIFLCGGLFAHLINKILEEEQRAGGESPQDPLASRSWDWIDPGLLPGSQMLEFANLFHQIGFLQTLIRRPGLNTGSFFLYAPGRKLRSRSQVPGIKKPGLSRAFYLATFSSQQRLRQSRNNILNTNHVGCSSCYSFLDESLKNILRPIPMDQPRNIPRFAPR